MMAKWFTSPEKVGAVSGKGQAGGHSGLRLGRQAEAGGDGELVGGGGGAGGVTGGREAVDEAGPLRGRGWGWRRGAGAGAVGKG
jgi:hypothetical protein